MFFSNRLISFKEIDMKTNYLAGCLFYAFCFIFGLYFAIYFVASIVGLVTGHLYLLPARGAPGVTIHGVWARIVSGIILAIFAAILRNVLKQRREKRCALIEQNNKDSDTDAAENQ